MHSVQTRCLLALGYSMQDIQIDLVRYPAAAEDANTIAQVSNLLTKIEAIDNALDTNLADSMAVAVADIRLDYGQYTAQSLGNRNRLLGRLSSLIGLDRKQANSSNSTSQTVYRAAY